jgi:hypothetical protein
MLLKVGGRDYFTRRNLIDWQDWFGLAVEPLGLLRGVRGSKAKHKEMRNAQRDLEIALARAKEEVERLEKLTTQNDQMNRDLARLRLRPQKPETRDQTENLT